MSKNFFLKKVVIIVLLCCTANSREIFEVQWVKNIDNNSLNNSTSFSEKIIALFLGENDISISRPCALSFNGTDLLYLSDPASGAVNRINLTQSELSGLFAGFEKPFPSVTAIFPARNDSVIFADSQLNQVFIFKSGQDQPRKIRLNFTTGRITGIIYHPLRDEYWFSDTGLHCIFVTDPDFILKRQIGNRGTGNSEFNFPTLMCLDTPGNIYIIDAMNFRVQIFNSKGEFESLFGSQGSSGGYFSRPRDIAVDDYGHIYITDSIQHNVQIFDRDGNFLFTFGSPGNADGEFLMPAGIAVNQKNEIFIADSFNQRIQVFKLKKASDD